MFSPSFSLGPRSWRKSGCPGHMALTPNRGARPRDSSLHLQDGQWSAGTMPGHTCPFLSLSGHHETGERPRTKGEVTPSMWLGSWDSEPRASAACCVCVCSAPLGTDPGLHLEGRAWECALLTVSAERGPDRASGIPLSGPALPFPPYCLSASCQLPVKTRPIHF